MATIRIRAVLFDLGGTLEDIYYDESLRLEATRGLHEILKREGLVPGLSVDDLYVRVRDGMKRYGNWREQTEIELPPERVWPEFILTGLLFSQERLAAAAEELAFYYDDHFHQRRLRPEAALTLEELRRQGFALGVISNIYSRGLVPYKLAQYGMAQFFPVVVTSSCFGWRKPNPRIFLEAARQLALPPEVCAYVGDTISRDVSGARRAGYGLVIQIKSFLTSKADREKDVEEPDAVIQDLREVVALITASRERVQI